MPKFEKEAGRRTGRTMSLGAILGAGEDAKAPAPRLTLKGNYTEPRTPFRERMRWLAKVRRHVAACRLEKRPMPHKVMAFAGVVAHVGDVCRLSFDGIAARAGMCAKTAQACAAWLEENGALTWSRTARMHKNGRMVRSSNLYTLIANFRGLVATVARAVRAIWRERSKTFPDSNARYGVTQPELFNSPKDREQARAALDRIARTRAETLVAAWTARRTAPA